MPRHRGCSSSPRTSLKGIGGYVSGILMAASASASCMDLRNQLFRHTLNQSAAFFARRSSGQLMSRITNDVNQVQMGVSETLADFLRESLAVVGFAWILFTHDWRLALLMSDVGAAGRVSARAARPARAAASRGAARRSSST